ncbi:MAG: hypothetical protein U1F23_11030 [Lysobacterales bacterium]
MRKLITLALACALGVTAAYADPLGSAFTYQGQLNDGGAPANGSYDLKFDLYTTASGGTSIDSIELDAQAVSGGLVNASLDFTDLPFNGQALWVEVSVRPAGDGSFTTLSPRQVINATPYALYALNAPGSGGGLTLPFAGSAASSGSVFSVTNTGSGGGIVANSAGSGIGNAALNVNSSGGIGAIITNTSTDTALLLGNNISGGTGYLLKAFVPAGEFHIDGQGNISSPSSASFNNGMTAASIAGDGVHGTSTTLSGVFGGSSSGAGVWGESAGSDGLHGHTSNLGGNGSASGVAGFGDNSNNGVFGLSETGNGGFFISGTGGNLGGAGVYTQLFNDCNSQASICPYAALIANNTGGGNIILGQNDAFTVFRVDGNGNVFAGTYQAGGADVAEFVPSTQSLEPGDVVAIDSDSGGAFRLATMANSTAVAGVISTQPGLTMNTSEQDDKAARGEPRLALTGRVPVKVTDQNGAIRPGDLLVSSSVPGRAMRAPTNPRPGTVIGKAMQPLVHGNGEIEMLVMLR